MAMNIAPETGWSAPDIHTGARRRAKAQVLGARGPFHIGVVMLLVPDITGGTGTESDETPGWWWPVGLSQSEGAHEMAVSVDGALFRVPGHLGVGRPSIYTTASGEI